MSREEAAQPSYGSLLDRELADKVEAHGFQSLDEAEKRVYMAASLTPENRRELMRTLRRLETMAKPGNWAWMKLEQEHGYCLDYQPADHGGDPAGYPH